jgi:transposase
MKTRYIGIDVGKRRCQACVTDEHGLIVDEFVFENSFEGISYLVGKVKPGPAKAVVESTGNLWLRIYEALESEGVEVKLANPFKTKAIASARIKTDKLSARILAHLLRADLIAECYVSSKETRKVNALLRQRASLTRIQTMVKNQVHSLLDKYGLKSDWSDIFGLHGMDWLRSLQLDPVDRCILDTHLRHLECLRRETEILDSKIAAKASESQEAKLLMSFTGIDYHSAMLTTSEIGDISRFPSSKHLVSWMGLCPSLHQSGNSTYMGRMKKDSNKRVRSILIQAAETAAIHDPRMKALYDRCAARHGHNKAIVRVANKMASITWHILTRKEPYQQAKDRLYASKLKNLTRVAA